MHLIDEQHTVTLVTIDGCRQMVGRACLNDDGDHLGELRAKVANEALRAFPAEAGDALDAFDRAFDEIERRPGDRAAVETGFPSGSVLIERILRAA